MLFVFLLSEQSKLNEELGRHLRYTDDLFIIAPEEVEPHKAMFRVEPVDNGDFRLTLSSNAVALF